MIKITAHWQQKYGYAVTYTILDSPHNDTHIKWFADAQQAREWMEAAS
jgi:hypothetical protein